MVSPEPSASLRVAFVTGDYPSPARLFEGTFVQQFVWAMARRGNQCTVIKPTSVFDRRYGPYPSGSAVEHVGGGTTVEVHRPRYLSFSSRKLGFAHTGRWTQRSFNRAVYKTAKALPGRWDIAYGHFLYQAGFAAASLGVQNGCVAVVGVGEDHFWTLAAFGEDMARQHYATGTHFLANSTLNRDLLVSHLGIDPERIMVAPNGVDLALMLPRNRESMRKKHGIKGAGFTIAFVGANEERKGPKRVLGAVQGLPDVQCIFAGVGTQTLEASCIVHKGPCGHGAVPELLSCADAFVLPTLSEGSCNAVIEAMACGLPIVTSYGRYMDDIVDDDVAIRVDPMDVRAIRHAILLLRDDPERRRRMSEACLRRAKRFDIDERARRVTKWMRDLVRKHRQ